VRRKASLESTDGRPVNENSGLYPLRISLSL
jgi:hypothetical protein